MKFIIVLLFFFIGLWILDLILCFTCCEAGFMGYDDKWATPFLEKLHYIIAPIGMYGSIVTGFIFLFLK